MSSRRAKPTEKDRQTAAALSRMWDEYRRQNLGPNGKPLTQSALVEGTGLSQSAVSQYLNGYLKFGYSAVLRFAKFFDVPPTQIRDDLDALPDAPGGSEQHTLDERPLLTGDVRDFVQMGIVVKALLDYLAILGKPAEYAADPRLLQIAYSIMIERGTPPKATASNVLDLTKRIAERMRKEAPGEATAAGAFETAFDRAHRGAGSS